MRGNKIFFRSRWKLAFLSSSKVIHSIFIIMVNSKSSRFDKGTGGKSGKFQFDCDGSGAHQMFRAEKRSAQASAHPLSQAQGGLFCVLTVVCLFVTERVLTKTE